MSKVPLLLLHGALGASTQFKSWIPFLENDFEVHTLDFEGHGKANSERPFRMEYFGENIQAYLDKNNIPEIHIFGYSMGGYAAIMQALKTPDRISGIMTFATKFAWSLETSKKETAFLNAEKIREKVPKFAEALAERHTATGWENVLEKTSEMMLDLGEKNPLNLNVLSTLTRPCLVGLGDQDNMVSLEETINAFSAMPESQLLVLPNTAHPIEKINPEKLIPHLKGFLKP